MNTFHEFNKKIIDMIIKEMKKQGVTAKEMAAKVGCTERYIQYMQTGKFKTLQIAYADRMLEALGMSITIGKKG